MSDRRDPPASQPFRILCLDGGGTFALIQAMALDALYPGQSGHEVLSHFDLVAGCSGGAVVTAGLLEGLGELYGTPATVTHDAGASEDVVHEVFRVELAAPGA